jgi:hypothetical protein
MNEKTETDNSTVFSPETRAERNQLLQEIGNIRTVLSELDDSKNPITLPKGSNGLITAPEVFVTQTHESASWLSDQLGHGGVVAAHTSDKMEHVAEMLRNAFFDKSVTIVTEREVTAFRDIESKKEAIEKSQTLLRDKREMKMVASQNQKPKGLPDAKTTNDKLITRGRTVREQQKQKNAKPNARGRTHRK